MDHEAAGPQHPLPHVQSVNPGNDHEKTLHYLYPSALCVNYRNFFTESINESCYLGFQHDCPATSDGTSGVRFWEENRLSGHATAVTVLRVSSRPVYSST
jgi:hypothetical protein